jgi:hypothetical protein
MPNPGHLPTIAKGKRINGVLANGSAFSNWAADTTRWTRKGKTHDVAQWEIAQ